MNKIGESFKKNQQLGMNQDMSQELCTCIASLQQGQKELSSVLEFRCITHSQKRVCTHVAKSQGIKCLASVNTKKTSSREGSERSIQVKHMIVFSNLETSLITFY